MKILKEFCSEKYRIISLGECAYQVQLKPCFSLGWYALSLHKLFYEAEDNLNRRVKEKRDMKAWGKVRGQYKVIREVNV